MWWAVTAAVISAYAASTAAAQQAQQTGRSSHTAQQDWMAQERSRMDRLRADESTVKRQGLLGGALIVALALALVYAAWVLVGA